MGAVAEHISQQANNVFYPDANTSTTDRLLASAEIGGGSVLLAAGGVELAAGTLTTAAATGGTVEVATTAGTVTTAACADGDCTNEARLAFDPQLTGAVQTAAASGDLRPWYKVLEGATRINPVKLNEFMHKSFNTDELRTLQFDFANRLQAAAPKGSSFDFYDAYNLLEGISPKTALVRETILWAMRRGVYGELVKLVETERPAIEELMTK
jgi:hypothetical protein